MPAATGALPSIERAIEVFIGGFTFTRSFTHPYVAEPVGPLWVARDAPRKSGKYRGEEWISHGTPPVEVDRIVREHARGRVTVCAMLPAGEPDAPLREGFRELGYRLLRTEPLMVHPLTRIPRSTGAFRAERVLDEDLARRLAKAARAQQILPEHLVDGAPLRQYVVPVDGELGGWVRSIQVGDASYVSDMFVRADLRRRGIATAMLDRMLRDDRAHGATASVLLASHMGAQLYPTAGYRQTGTLYMYTPPR